MGRRRRAAAAALEPGEKLSSPPPRRWPPEDIPALRRRLLGLIRGFYLDAFSRLPTADIRATLARGLHFGGHCFGPLHPVDNIIANSVWFAAAFPLRPEDRMELGVLSTQATDRVVRRSLDGLVACLLHICPFLSQADALWQLSRSRADLRVASVVRAAELEAVKAAFEVAATAAQHPNPAAFALFASSVLPDVERDVSLLLASKSGLSSLDIDRLSSLDIRRLSSVLLPYPLPDDPCRPRPNPCPRINGVISGKKRGIKKWYQCLLEIADAALCKFTTQTGLHYELHTIYGESLLEDEDYHDHFHINFIGQPKEDHTSSSSGVASGHRLFFFAEVPRPGHIKFLEEDVAICCLVEPLPGDIGTVILFSFYFLSSNLRTTFACLICVALETAQCPRHCSCQYISKNVLDKFFFTFVAKVVDGFL